MNQANQTVCIKRFLTDFARPDLADLYNEDMEVQVNVGQHGGERVTSIAAKKTTTWQNTTNGDVWFNIRMPQDAYSEPVDNDKPMKYDLTKYADGIGLTGWNWRNKKSQWVAFDFDAIAGHSDKHVAKLSESQLEEVRKAACQIPWVTVRKSTSGNGLHLYVFFDPDDPDTNTVNHNEHAAVGKAVLHKMSALAKFDFTAKVDACGGVMWVWHTKFKSVGGVSGEGLKLIKEGTKLDKIPVNWRDYAKAISRGSGGSKPGFIPENDAEITKFEQMCSQYPKVTLDEQHIALMTFLDKRQATWWWDGDHRMLVCHTYDLLQAHKELGFRGIYTTNSTGKNQGDDQNAFAYPLRDGAWVVRRQGRGTTESKTWDLDNSGWTRCYLNKAPDLRTAAKAHDGAEDERGSYLFSTASVALKAAKELGAVVALNEAYHNRKAALRNHKDGRLIFEIDKMDGDNVDLWMGWADKKTRWVRVLMINKSVDVDKEIHDLDDVIRHMVLDGSDAGWALNSSGEWATEPKEHLKLALQAYGHNPKDAALIMGKAVINRWLIVNRPFEEEYLPNRHWNKDAAQFSMPMSMEDTENLHYPTWTKMLEHVGQSLNAAVEKNQWCIENKVKTGGEYLMLWIAALFQRPTEPLPYLFFHGPQESGKSSFHEAISLLVVRGVKRADAALTSPSGFNGELLSAVLCVVEETDLRQNKSAAYNRIKDWVTSRIINIHPKGITPYPAPNTTHWVQCSNDAESCPVFPDDTRITMCFVDSVPAAERLPKPVFFERLKKEGPDFLRHVRTIELPEMQGRLLIPVVETEDKKKMQKSNATDLEIFLDENCFYAPGKMVSVAEFTEKFHRSLDDTRRGYWTKQKITRNMPNQFVKGRDYNQGSRHFYGNMAWEMPKPEELNQPKFIAVGEKLVLESS